MEINTEHIISYLEGKLSTDAKLEFERNIENSPELQKELADIRFIWNTSAELKHHHRINTNRNWSELSRRMKNDVFRRRLGGFFRNAAAILLIPLLITSYLIFEKVKADNDLPVEITELISAPGIVSRVILPDGSEVWLNSGSALSYPTRFIGKREVFLKGEAYFKVVSDTENRFEVMTEEGLSVSAYGTEFNVNAYNDESHITATLVEGNIEVSHPAKDDTYVVKPSHQLAYDRESGEVETSYVNMAVVTGWKDGKMVFRRAGMQEITRRLSRRFNVDIRLEGEEIYGYEYSATFTHESLPEILHLLENSAPIRCRIIEPEQTDDLSYTRRIVVISAAKKR